MDSSETGSDAGGASGQSTSCRIRVLARFRPLTEVEEKEGQRLVQLAPKSNRVKVGKLKFAFDGVLPPETPQQRIHETVGKVAVDELLRGYNSTIFAYGQTGSGKTHTMYGKWRSKSLRGLVPRAAAYLFQCIAGQAAATNEPGEDGAGEGKKADAADGDEAAAVPTEYLIKLSMLEIYNEQVRDLLNPDGTNLRIRETDRKGVWVEGMTEEFATCVKDVAELVKAGLKYRSIASTLMNIASSRSHCVLVLQLVQNFKDGSSKVSQMNLVDLAGSERVARSGATGSTLQEARNINQSLSALGNCIHALAAGTRSHIPYRDSKLTHFLKESIGGNCKTFLIITASLAKSSEEETVSTLRFGVRAKKIKNRVRVNRKLSPEQLSAKLEALIKYVAVIEKENEGLKEEVKQLQSDLATHAATSTSGPRRRTGASPGRRLKQAASSPNLASPDRRGGGRRGKRKGGADSPAPRGSGKGAGAGGKGGASGGSGAGSTAETPSAAGPGGGAAAATDAPKRMDAFVKQRMQLNNQQQVIGELVGELATAHMRTEQLQSLLDEQRNLRDEAVQEAQQLRHELGVTIRSASEAEALKAENDRGHTDKILALEAHIRRLTDKVQEQQREAALSPHARSGASKYSERHPSAMHRQGSSSGSLAASYDFSSTSGSSLGGSSRLLSSTGGGGIRGAVSSSSKIPKVKTLRELSAHLRSRTQHILAAVEADLQPSPSPSPPASDDDGSDDARPRRSSRFGGGKEGGDKEEHKGGGKRPGPDSTGGGETPSTLSPTGSDDEDDEDMNLLGSDVMDAVAGRRSPIQTPGARGAGSSPTGASAATAPPPQPATSPPPPASDASAVTRPGSAGSRRSGRGRRGSGSGSGSPSSGRLTPKRRMGGSAALAASPITSPKFNLGPTTPGEGGVGGTGAAGAGAGSMTSFDRLRASLGSGPVRAGVGVGVGVDVGVGVGGTASVGPTGAPVPTAGSTRGAGRRPSTASSRTNTAHGSGTPRSPRPGSGARQRRRPSSARSRRASFADPGGVVGDSHALLEEGRRNMEAQLGQSLQQIARQAERIRRLESQLEAATHQAEEQQHLIHQREARARALETQHRAFFAARTSGAALSRRGGGPTGTAGAGAGGGASGAGGMAAGFSWGRYGDDAFGDVDDEGDMEDGDDDDDDDDEDDGMASLYASGFVQNPFADESDGEGGADASGSDGDDDLLIDTSDAVPAPRHRLAGLGDSGVFGSSTRGTGGGALAGTAGAGAGAAAASSSSKPGSGSPHRSPSRSGPRVVRPVGTGRSRQTASSILRRMEGMLEELTKAAEPAAP